MSFTIVHASKESIEQQTLLCYAGRFFVLEQPAADVDVKRIRMFKI